MHTTNCDLCDNPAVIHDTVARGGVVKIRHLCRSHGLKLWRDAVVPAAETVANLGRTQTVNSAVTIPPMAARPDRKFRRDHKHR